MPANQKVIDGVQRIKDYLEGVEYPEFKNAWMTAFTTYREPETQLTFTAYAYHEKALFFQILKAKEMEDGREALYPESIAAIGFYDMMGEILQSLDQHDKDMIAAVVMSELSEKENANG